MGFAQRPIRAGGALGGVVQGHARFESQIADCVIAKTLSVRASHAQQTVKVVVAVIQRFTPSLVHNLLNITVVEVGVLQVQFGVGRVDNGTGLHRRAIVGADSRHSQIVGVIARLRDDAVAQIGFVDLATGGVVNVSDVGGCASHALQVAGGVVGIVKGLARAVGRAGIFLGAHPAKGIISIAGLVGHAADDARLVLHLAQGVVRPTGRVTAPGHAGSAALAVVASGSEGIVSERCQQGAGRHRPLPLLRQAAQRVVVDKLVRNYCVMVLSDIYKSGYLPQPINYDHHPQQLS